MSALISLSMDMMPGSGMDQVLCGPSLVSTPSNPSFAPSLSSLMSLVLSNIKLTGRRVLRTLDRRNTELYWLSFIQDQVRLPGAASAQSWFLDQFDSETGLRSPGVHLLPDYLIRRGAQPGLGGDQPMGTGICYGNWNYDVETRKNTV